MASAGVNLSAYPNVDFYFKLVAVVNDQYYSIYDGSTQYTIG